jgi:hypothetical protein
MILPQEILEYGGFSIIECSQPKGIQTKMRGYKLRSGIYLQGALKQKGVKQVGNRTRTTLLVDFGIIIK